MAQEIVSLEGKCSEVSNFDRSVILSLADPELRAVGGEGQI